MQISNEVVFSITEKDRHEIAEILDRRANEVAGFLLDYQKQPNYFGSVELALTREVSRLRKLSEKIKPTPQDYEDDRFS